MLVLHEFLGRRDPKALKPGRGNPRELVDENGGFDSKISQLGDQYNLFKNEKSKFRTAAYNLP